MAAKTTAAANTELVYVNCFGNCPQETPPFFTSSLQAQRSTMAAKTAAAANAKLVAATSRVNQLVAEAEDHSAEMRKVGAPGLAGFVTGAALLKKDFGSLTQPAWLVYASVCVLGI